MFTRNDLFIRFQNDIFITNTISESLRNTHNRLCQLQKRITAMQKCLFSPQVIHEILSLSRAMMLLQQK